MRSALAALALVALYVAGALLVGYESDDGYIVYRYVANFLGGHGFVYNPGELVQGYSCPSWLLLLTAGAALFGVQALPTIASVLGLVAGSAAVLLLFGFAGDVMRERGARRLLAPALLAVHGSFLAWGTGGLETTLYAALLFAGGWLHLRALESPRVPWAVGLLFGLAALTRFEAALPFGLTVLHRAWSEMRRGRSPLGAPTLGMGVVFVATVAPWLLFAWRFYGDPVPNTAYVKLDPGLRAWGLGLAYLERYVAAYGPALLAAPLLLLALPASRRPWQGYVALVLAGELAWVAAAGGDGLAFHRFVAHVAPWLQALVAAGLLAGWDALGAGLRGGVRTFARAAALLFLATGLWTTASEALLPVLRPDAVRWTEDHSGLVFPGRGEVHDYTWFDRYFVARQAAAGHWLDAHAAPGDWVAATPAGSIAFHTQHPVIDMLGLNDAHIAHTASGHVGFLRPGHMKGDGAYVLSRRPAYVLLGNVAVLPFPIRSDEEMEAKLVRKSEHELWALPAFRREYERVVVPLDDAGPFRWFTFYRRRDLAGASVSGGAAKNARAASAASPTNASGAAPSSQDPGISPR